MVQIVDHHFECWQDHPRLSVVGWQKQGQEWERRDKPESWQCWADDEHSYSATGGLSSRLPPDTIIPGVAPMDGNMMIQILAQQLVLGISRASPAPAPK